MQTARGASSALIITVAFAGAAEAASDPSVGNYPNRPIRLIVPNTPGGPTDAIGRLVGQKLSENFGQPVVPDNRGGAAGNLGCEMVAKAVPDGYTILIAAGGCLALNQFLYENFPFDPSRAFEPVTQLTRGSQMLTIHPSVPANSVKEFVAFAKSKPGSLNYASGGAGTIPHLAAEMFKMTAGLQMTHVPYKGTGPAMIALLGGQVQVMVASLPAAIPQVKAGKLRGLAVTSAQRAKAAPDLPTIAESGYPGFETSSWHAIMLPAKTPKAIVTLLNAQFVRILNQPEVRERLEREGLEPVGNTPEQLRAHIARETQSGGKVIKALGIKAD